MSRSSWGGGTASRSSRSLPKDVGERLVMVEQWIRKRPNRGWATFEELKSETGLDLINDNELFNRVKDEPQAIDVGDGCIRFHHDLAIFCKEDFLRELEGEEKHAAGIPLSRVQDCYPAIQRDLTELAEEGRIIAMWDKGTRAEAYFPRLAPKRVKLSARLAVEELQSFNVVTTTQDLRSELRPGDGLQFGRFAGRVHYETTRGLESIRRTFYSLTSHKPSPIRQQELDENLVNPMRPTALWLNKEVPVDMQPSAAHSPQPFEATRFGCTNDIRDAWDDAGPRSREVHKPWPHNKEALRAEVRRRQAPTSARRRRPVKRRR